MLKEVNYIDLLGVPFCLGGRGPNFLDCWGLCLEIGRRVDLDYPQEFTPDNTTQQDEAIKNGRDVHFEKIEKPEPFCIVTFSIKVPFVDHCGIVLPDCKTFLHTMKGHNVAVCRLDHRILNKRIEGFYKLR